MISAAATGPRPNGGAGSGPAGGAGTGPRPGREALADLDRLTTTLRDGTQRLARQLAAVEREDRRLGAVCNQISDRRYTT